MSRKCQLSAVVGFADSSGRTSCALEETEHYRLRTLGLIQIAKAAHQKCYQSKQWLLHWHSRNRYLAATTLASSLKTNDAGEVSHDDLRQKYAAEEELVRCKSLMASKSEEIPRLEAKQAYAEAELKVVLLRYNNLIHPTICSELYAKLPRELRNMVYLHIDTFKDDIQVEHSTQGTNGVPTSPFFDGDCSAHAWGKLWYFDPSCIGPYLAREMVELQYGRSKFCLNDHALIPRLLREDRWKTGAVPRNHIRRIELDVLDEQEFEDELAQMRLRDNIGLLHQLEAGAKISINFFNLSPSLYDRSHLSDNAKDEERSPKIRVAHSSSRAVHATSIYAKLAPALRDLKKQGHTVVLENRPPEVVGKPTFKFGRP